MFNYTIRQKKSIFSKLQTLTPPLRLCFDLKLAWVDCPFAPSLSEQRQKTETTVDFNPRVETVYFDALYKC